MDELILVFKTYLLPLGGWGILILLVLYVAFFPDKAEKFSALFWKCLRFIYRGAEKKYITHDIQGRVNDYVNNYLVKEISGFVPVNIKLEWVDDKKDADAFRRDGKIVVRMRNSKNQNKNFVNASMVFISEHVLDKAKRYVSKKQRESIDLFVGKKLFEKEKEEVVVQFVDDFLHTVNKDEKIGELFEKYNNIDKTGLFFPVFVQEMTFLGEKVFGSHVSKNKVFEEVAGLIDFLNKYSSKKLGEDVETKFNGTYLKFGIMIVGNSFKVERLGINPYTTHIQNLAQQGYETIYLIGSERKQNFIKIVCSEEFLKRDKIHLLHKRSYEAIIKDSNGKPFKLKTYLTVLRKDEIGHYIDQDASL